MRGSKGGRRPPDGEIRLSQVVTSYGPGSMVDLPERSVIVSGLDHWRFPTGERTRVSEPRLAAAAAAALGLEEVALYEPPVNAEDPRSPGAGVPAFIFPTWFLAQVDETWTDPVTKKVYRTRPLVEWGHLVERRWLDADRKKREVVPVRFVAACADGHISDINWYAYVYKDFSAGRRGQLWLDEGGISNDFSEIFVRCEATGARRALSDAKAPGARALGLCNGRRPWLGGQSRERGCEEESRLLVRSASNAYFSQTLRVISIPDRQDALRQRVDPLWEDFLQYCEDEADVARERRKARVAAQIEGFTDAEVWAHLQARRDPQSAPKRGVKQAEIETLLASEEAVGEDRPDGDFYARGRSLPNLPPWLDQRLERVVLVHRLREVVTQIGFTRFEPEEPDPDGQFDLEVARAALAAETTWLPAYQNRGEGVLLSFRRSAIEAWMKQAGVRRRGEQLLAGLGTWFARKGQPERTPGPSILPYLMLHSLSHLLITAVALECGYSSSAIGERVYAGAGGFGVLLYTGTAGSEGTLGGLVAVGERIEHHLSTALELGRLCSNDPVCAYHEADDPREERFRHGAACHGCLLISETSCERRNELLDRALVVPTVYTPDAAFFPMSGL